MSHKEVVRSQTYILAPEDLLRVLERVIDRTQFGRCLTLRLNVPSIEEINTVVSIDNRFVQFKLYLHIALTAK